MLPPLPNIREAKKQLGMFCEIQISDSYLSDDYQNFLDLTVSEFELPHSITSTTPKTLGNTIPDVVSDLYFKTYKEVHYDSIIKTLMLKEFKIMFRLFDEKGVLQSSYLMENCRVREFHLGTSKPGHDTGELISKISVIGNLTCVCSL